MQAYRAGDQHGPPHETSFFILLLLCAFQFFVIAYLLIVAGAIPKIEGKSSPTDAMLVLLTFSYVVVNGFILAILYRQLRATEKSNYLTLRAWLVAEDIDPMILFPDAENTIRMAIRNVGKLPAIGIDSMSETIVRPTPITWPQPLPHTDKAREFVIGAGQVNTVTLVVGTFPLDTVHEITTGMQQLGLMVRITYTDALSTFGLTDVSAFYIPDKRTFVLAPKGNAIR